MSYCRDHATALIENIWCEKIRRSYPPIATKYRNAPI